MDNKTVQSRIERFIATVGVPPKLPPKPQVVEQPDDSDDEEPPPVPIDPDWTPIFASHLLAKQNSSPQAPAFTMDHNIDTTFDSRRGERAPPGMCFCPYLAVTKYCYKFVPKNFMQPIASTFFDADKIWCRDWDLYYVSTSYSGVVTFVPEQQLQALLREINATFPDAKLTITDEDRSYGLVLDFEELPENLKPRFLGRCNSRSKHASWIYQLEQEPNMVIPNSGNRSIEAFKAQMDAAIALSKNKNKAGKGKKLQENILKRQDMVKQTLRTQRYLGLLPKKDESALLPDLNNLTITPLDPSKPAPHPFDNEPIFIAIDVEAYEKPPRWITEVGFATLDTRDLQGIAPGVGAKNWFEHIRARHFRTLEYKNLVNHEYVQGCPDHFEFGESEFVAKVSLPNAIAACFREPFSKQAPYQVQDLPALAGNLNPHKTRNIVLVGHDLGQDVTYFQQIGYNILNLNNLFDKADTADMFRSYTKDPNSRSLGSILYDFDIAGWHLHNAGNDAVYTLQAMLAICVQSAAGGREADAERAQESERQREESLVEGAMERASEAALGWEAADGEDGGVAVKPKEGDYRKPSKQFGPPRPSPNGLYTMGVAPLDV